MRLLYDRPLRSKLGQDARSIVVRKHSWETVAEATTQLFQQIIDLKNTGARTTTLANASSSLKARMAATINSQDPR